LSVETEAYAARGLWDFSLAVYDRPGVAAACLALQDRHGLDVNLLLFCCWASSMERALDPATLAAAEAAVSTWRNQVVRPMRALRRRLKREVEGFPAGEVEALRGRLLEAELEAERLEQGRIEGFLPAPAATAETGPALALRALRLYFRLQGVDPDDVDDRDCLALLTGTFPEASPQSLSAVFSG
jgi:uncharacterized protein (TIGR02444 family)